jgi:hypothetical protein
MTYSEAIKTGFNTINRLWQLIAVQAGLMVINCIGFFVIVGIPLGIAFVIFGLDLTGITQAKDFFSMFTSPSDFISKYLWLVLMVVISIVFYILIVTTLGLFVFSGSAGMIGQGIFVPSAFFSMKRFFSEGRQLFFPIMWFSGLMGLLFIVVAFMLGLLGGGIAAVVSAAKGHDSTLALFLGIFFWLLLSLAAVSLILAILAVTVYGIAILFFRREGSVKTLRASCLFLWNRQDAFWLYILLLLGYVTGSFVMMLISYPFYLVPILGPIISFPLQLISYIGQGYLGLIVLAVVFVYYHELEIRKDMLVQAVAGQEAAATAEGSRSPEDTSVVQEPAQEAPRPAPDEKPEG